MTENCRHAWCSIFCSSQPKHDPLAGRFQVSSNSSLLLSAVLGWSSVVASLLLNVRKELQQISGQLMALAWAVPSAAVELMC